MRSPFTRNCSMCVAEGIDLNRHGRSLTRVRLGPDNPGDGYGPRISVCPRHDLLPIRQTANREVS